MRTGVAFLMLGLLPATGAAQQSLGDWPQHSMDRPRPPVVAPAKNVAPAPPPSDAVVLFDGRGLAKWQRADGGPPPWKVVAGGAMEVVPGSGDLATVERFGDVQLHVEWATPAPPTGEGQERGNSGVFLMGRYELQVLDSHDNVTYADGQAAAIYGQYPPLVNASRPAGEWQSYDIIFHRPRFDGSGKLFSPARFTVLHNGVLVQDNVALTGPTANQRRPPYEVHPDRLPLVLQDHNSKVRFRNIWARDLERR